MLIPLTLGQLKCISARLVDVHSEKLVDKLDFEFFVGQGGVLPDIASLDTCLTRLANLPHIGSEYRSVKFVLLFLVDCSTGERHDGFILADDAALVHIDNSSIAAESISDSTPLLTTDGEVGVCIRMAVRHSVVL